MKFTIAHSRGGTGTDLAILVEAEKGSITLVRIVYDGFLIASDVQQPPVARYSREFLKQGGGAPGMVHALSVSAYDDERKLISSENKWEDKV